MELDLATVDACVSGPKRPHDKVAVSNMPADFQSCLTSPVGFKGFNVGDTLTNEKEFTFEGENYKLKHGSVVIAAITSCTNTSNPEVMIAAGLICKYATEKGLKVPPYIKTSLAPGSGVVTKYLEVSETLSFLEAQGFHLAGYGCTTCIGNSGELDEAVTTAIQESDLVTAAVLSGNRNFEGRVHPLTRANYLASPPLVVAYALAGRVDFDFETEPLGRHGDTDVFLRDIWPSRAEVKALCETVIKPEMFRECYEAISKGTDRWNQLQVEEG